MSWYVGFRMFQTGMAGAQLSKVRKALYTNNKNQSAVSTVIGYHWMIELFECFQDCWQQTENLQEPFFGKFLQDPGSSKCSVCNIGEIVWCDTFNVWCALVYIMWPLLDKPETPASLNMSHDPSSFSPELQEEKPLLPVLKTFVCHGQGSNQWPCIHEADAVFYRPLLWLQKQVRVYILKVSILEWKICLFAKNFYCGVL